MRKMLLAAVLSLSLLVPSLAKAQTYTDQGAITLYMLFFGGLDIFGLGAARSEATPAKDLKLTKLQKEFYDLSQDPKSLDLLSQSAAGIKTAK